ncbi:uncharacterized protein LOC123451813 [Hordeum vulgare subsp. vulgare]|uniref:uncharacterized protein LOC123451813 n=1 Tax=Hordeum vulgare subsp. vulgare TaxID=112509 RepID=UPI001D1A37A3|nr:uncharacterized protein LOC123451813 [Hordeum vulgare subsp. vulgare]
MPGILRINSLCHGHHWDMREDTSLQLLYFSTKSKRKELKRTQGKNVVNNVHKPSEHNQPGKHGTTRLSKGIERAADLAGSAKGKKVMEILIDKYADKSIWND